MAKDKISIPHIAFEITNECNLKCLYCYNHWKRNDSEFVILNSYKKAQKVLKQLFRIAHVKNVAFTGGEPFLGERIAELVLYCRMKGASITIISNGNAGTQEDYKQLIDLGVNLFEFPLHARNPQIHDSMTGVKGSWEHSYNSIAKVQEMGAYVVPVIVLTKFNYLQIEDTLLFLRELNLNRIMLNRYNIGGASIAKVATVLVPNEELKETFRIANEVVGKYGLRVTSNVCTPFCLLNPEDYSNIGFGACSKDPLRKPLTLDIEGNLRVCNHSPVIAGNIFKQPLVDILYSDYTLSWGETTPEFCEQCAIFDKCMGGCRAASEQMGFSLKKVDPVLECNNFEL